MGRSAAIYSTSGYGSAKCVKYFSKLMELCGFTGLYDRKHSLKLPRNAFHARTLMQPLSLQALCLAARVRVAAGSGMNALSAPSHGMSKATQHRTLPATVATIHLRLVCEEATFIVAFISNPFELEIIALVARLQHF